MNRRLRVAGFLVAVIAWGALGQLASHSASLATARDHDESVQLVGTHHESSALAAVSRLTRGVRAVDEVLSVPLSDVLALVALLAMWLGASVRRRERLACAVVTYRHRGPPVPQHVA